MEKKPRAGNRFTKQEIVEQETLAWRIKKQGATWKQVAEAHTATASDGKPISESTAHERGNAALRHYRVERDEWDNQRREHLAEAEMVKEKVMQMLLGLTRTTAASQNSGPCGKQWSAFNAAKTRL